MILRFGLMFFVLVLTSLVFAEGGGVNDSNATGGQIFSDQRYRIFIGGSHVANIEEAPFVVVLTRLKESSGIIEAFCTGAIILERWVLTAAHCVESYLTEGSRRFQVYAGCDSEREFDPGYPFPGRQIRDPVRILRHPYYRENRILAAILGGDRSAYDVGLIEVDNFRFGTKVKSIQLWSKTWEGVQDDGEYFSTVCTAYGWGLEDPKTPTEDLRTGKFIVRHGISGCQCPSDAPHHRDDLLWSDDYERLSLCTAAISGKSLCPGDSGGPLVCNGLLAGVARAGVSCYYKYDTPGDICGLSGLISEWTYVCPMLQWIHWKIPELPGLPPSCRSPPSLESSLVAPALLLVHSIIA